MLRAAILGVAHVHAPSYARCLSASCRARLACVWDNDPARAEAFGSSWGVPAARSREEALAQCDVAVIAGENLGHGDAIEACLESGVPVICEKPLAASWDEHDRIAGLVSQSPTLVATAFPCPHSPVFKSLLSRVQAGDLGEILAVSGTNRGQCPFDWFVDPARSGGGAMIDHVVHLADLYWRLLGKEPEKVTASVGHNMHRLACEDTAHVMLRYGEGLFATIDSSWSRSKSFETWGDVTLRVVGETGVAEADLFGQGVRVLTDRTRLRGTGSDLDGPMLEDFLSSVQEGRPPMSTAEDGLRASRVALAGYGQRS
ncbi:MAG: Gfo/Idh/MocA family oxidoreductase [Fimbriimonadaceae bacterium]|nr:Gfo/Idh/MocA family oxidoreductase [Fimbriimonadaceae bacterium]QYK58625.1 MAG: Gfo/Idh/MocA family oxidoreductase [Fimbriimonadaceae bacterium]